MSTLTRVAWRTMVVVTVFNAVAAVTGAIAIFLTNGLGMPRSILAGSPFTSFVVPGIMLLAGALPGR